MSKERKEFFRDYDMDATSFKYGRIGGPGGLPISGSHGVETSGSSTTVTAISGTPFDPVVVGDWITFLEPPDTETLRQVATKTDGTEITVNSAIDLSSGAAFFFEPFRVGALDTDGWHPVNSYRECTVFIDGATIAAGGGVGWEIQTLGPRQTPLTLKSGTMAASGAQVSYALPQEVTHVRVGLKGVSDATGTDVVSAWLIGHIGRV